MFGLTCAPEALVKIRQNRLQSLVSIKMPITVTLTELKQKSSMPMTYSKNLVFQSLMSPKNRLRKPPLRLWINYN